MLAECRKRKGCSFWVNDHWNTDEYRFRHFHPSERTWACIAVLRPGSRVIDYEMYHVHRWDEGSSPGYSGDDRREAFTLYHTLRVALEGD